MCGIIGIISKDNITQKLVNNLKKLEYRGYDSAGICVVDNNTFCITKQIGEVDKLKEKVNMSGQGSFGIGHTRWATHGKANNANCHPHISYKGSWAIVHNGIIENYLDLKHLLQDKGIKFVSATDSECVAHLLEYNNVTDIKGIVNTVKQLKGSYALAMVNRFIEDKIFVARKGSPLYIAKCGEDMYISSDIVSFYGLAKEFYALGEDELGIVGKNYVEFFDNSGKTITKQPQKLVYKQSKTALTEGHYMLKEIYEISSLLKDVYRYYTNNEELIFDMKRLFKQCSQVLFIGCGTAYHSGLIGEHCLNAKLKKPISTHIASEFIYDNTYIDTGTIAVFISQSGETADTIAALKKAKQSGATTIALTNNVNSQIAFLADYTLPVLAGVEIAVASTKAYNCQCFVFTLLASFVSGGLGYIKSFDDLVYALNNVDNGLCLDIAKNIKTLKNAFFIGRGKDYITCLEASLKLKEISYINAVACPSGELKHGSLALIEKGTTVFMPITEKALKEKSLISLGEVKTRGGKVIVLSPFDEVKQYIDESDTFIKLPDLEDQTYQLATVYFQLIAYHTSSIKGINPDKPRNLAKSVTVE